MLPVSEGKNLDSKGCQLHWADHCKYRNDRSGGGRNQFGFETIIYRRKSVFPDYCGSSMGTVSLRDMLADSFVDVLLSKDGDGPDLFTWDGSEFDSFDCLDNRIQMVDESVCNFAKADGVRFFKYCQTDFRQCRKVSCLRRRYWKRV